MKNQLRKVHGTLRKIGLTLATAESCTGGWVAKLFTDLSGASDYFQGGAVVYSNKAKRKILGVPTGDRQSAVTRNMALELARRAQRRFGTDLVVSTTGYMEPGSWLTPSLRKKRITGICYVAVVRHYAASSRANTARVRKIFLHGTRHQNRLSASFAVVSMVAEELKLTRKETST